MGLARAVGSLVVVGALAGSGYAAYELYDAQQVREELGTLRAEVRDLRNRQAGMRADTVTGSDLGNLTELVRRLDAELTDLRGHVTELAESDDTVDLLREDVDRLARTATVLTSCLERGLEIEEDGRAHCVP